MLQKTPRLGPPPSHADQEQRTLRLAFDDFGWASAETLASRLGLSVEEWVARCCVAYAARHGGGALSLQPPRFKSSEGETRKLRIALPTATWATLDRASLGSDLEWLVEHAAISHAAREQEWTEAPLESEARGPVADGHAWAGRRRLVAACAIVVGILMVPVTLAAAGVSLPGPVGSAFERVGIELPYQAQGPPPPVVLKDPRGSRERSIPGRASERAAEAGREQAGGMQKRLDRTDGERSESTVLSPVGQLPAEVPPAAIVPETPAVVPDVPAEPEPPAVSDPTLPGDEGDGGRVTDEPENPLGGG